MPFVYILRCADGPTTLARPTIFSLDSMNTRGGADYTAARRPVEMVYAEEHSSICGAKNRELQLKHWSRVKKEALIAQDLGRLKRV
jgi:predicted GIY-YIG superfamily endonuclease